MILQIFCSNGASFYVSNPRDNLTNAEIEKVIELANRFSYDWQITGYEYREGDWRLFDEED